MKFIITDKKPIKKNRKKYFELTSGGTFYSPNFFGLDNYHWKSFWIKMIE